MRKFNTKKSLLIGFLVYLSLCIVGGLCAIPFIISNSKDCGFFESYQEKTIEFIRSNTDVYEKYGSNVYIEINKYSWTCEEEYLDSRGMFATVDAAEINDIELFLDVVKEMVFYVEVSNQERFFSDSPICVVTMKKNDSGDMFFSEWHWAE